MEHKKSTVKDIIIPIGSLLIGVIGLITAIKELPSWAILAMIIYLVFVVVVVIKNPSVTIWKRLSTRLKERNISKKHFSDLKGIVGDFVQLVDENRVNSIPILLRNLTSHNQLENKRIENYLEQNYTIKIWAQSIVKQSDRIKMKEFRFVVGDFGEIISRFSRFCNSVYKELETIISSVEMPAHQLKNIKQQWNMFREEHKRITDNIRELNKKLNKAHGERIYRDYFEPVKMLD